MRTSQNIKEIALALAKFQSEVKNPANVAKNPFLGNKYAPLNEVLNTVRPVLAKYGLSVVQDTGSDSDAVQVSTFLLHESGEWIQTDALSIVPEKMTPQGIGSVITYARRYSLSALLGISSEDDDDANSQEKFTQGNTQVVTQASNVQPQDASKVIINFGKYKGKSIAEVAKTDRQYIEWLADKAEKQDLRNAAKALLIENETPAQPKAKEKKQAIEEEVPSFKDFEQQYNIPDIPETDLPF